MKIEYFESINLINMKCCPCFKSKNIIDPIKIKVSHDPNRIDPNSKPNLQSKNTDNVYLRGQTETVKFDKFKNSKSAVEKDQALKDSPRKKKLHDKESINFMNKPHFEFQDKFMCLFCGGKDCAHENWTLNQNSAIKGLHSDQVTDNIFASQRPSTRLIKEYKIIDQFHKLDIGLIINLQLQGEHPYCGDKLDKVSGFSYNPQVFISENIKCINPGWKDMSVPDSLNFMLNIVKEMSVTIKEEGKKVMVHCHAGYGRTGCVIACYMIYDYHDTLDNIVKALRSKRQQCIQKKSQLDFCKRFQEYIQRARIIFTPTMYSVDYFMKNQHDLSFGIDGQTYEYIPKLVKKIFDRIITLQKENPILEKDLFKSFLILEYWSNENEEKLLSIKKLLNIGIWSVFEKIDSVELLVLLLNDWIEDSVESMILPEKIMYLFTKVINEDELENIVKNFRASESIEKKAFLRKIKKGIRRLEFEIISNLTEFLNEISPQENCEITNYYFERMRDKLILSFTGINVDAVGYKIETKINSFSSGNLPEEVRKLIKYITLIIQFLTMIKKTEIDEQNSFMRMDIESVISSKIASDIDQTYFKGDRSRKQSFVERAGSSPYIGQTLNYSEIKSYEGIDDKDYIMIYIKECIDNYFQDKLKKGIIKSNSRSYFNSPLEKKLSSEVSRNRSSSFKYKNIFSKIKEFIMKETNKETTNNFSLQEGVNNNIIINKNQNKNIMINFSNSGYLSDNKVKKCVTKFDKSLPIIEEVESSPFDLMKSLDFNNYVNLLKKGMDKKYSKGNTHDLNEVIGTEEVTHNLRKNKKSHSSIVKVNKLNFDQYKYSYDKVKNTKHEASEIDISKLDYFEENSQTNINNSNLRKKIRNISSIKRD